MKSIWRYRLRNCSKCVENNMLNTVHQKHYSHCNCALLFCIDQIFEYAPGVLCNVWYPSETHPKLKSCENSFVHNIRLNDSIVLQFCTSYGSIVAVQCAKFQNDWTIEISYRYPILHSNPGIDPLTHWGWVTHICVNKLIVIGSDIGLSPRRRQTNIWTNGGRLLIRTLGSNVSDILNDFIWRKCIWKCRLVNGDHSVSASTC